MKVTPIIPLRGCVDRVCWEFARHQKFAENRFPMVFLIFPIGANCHFRVDGWKYQKVMEPKALLSQLCKHHGI